MKFFFSILMVCLMCVTIQGFSQASKLGHINSAELLQAMPEIKAADSSLQDYQQQLEDQNQSMLTEYKTKLDDYTANKDKWPDAVLEVKEGELSDMQQRIQTFQQTAQEKFAQKKEELYSPILKKAEDAIKQVAKDANYTYVFDTSAGAVIYAAESDDLMILVKKKLGVK